MNRVVAKRAAKKVILGFVVVFGVVLLTLIFSVLGAITCAVLLGVLMGSVRQWRWEALLISLVFPAVILTMAQVARAFPWRQSVSLSALCFGAFWVLYLMTMGLLWFEAKSVPEPEAVRPAKFEPPSLHKGVSIFWGVPGQPPVDSALQELQGTWSYEELGPEGLARRRVLEISNDRIRLTILDHTGHIRFLAGAGVRLEQFGPFRTLKILDPKTDAGTENNDEWTFGLAWVYRVNDRVLTIGCNFDDSGPGLEPMIETYRKLGDRG